MTDYNVELLPCAHCGGEAEVEDYGGKSIWLGCPSCDIGIANLEGNVAHCSKAWNRRADLPLDNAIGPLKFPPKSVREVTVHVTKGGKEDG